MSDRKKCEGCEYWVSGAGQRTGSGDMKFCHHLLRTGKRRVEVDGICESRVPHKRKKKPVNDPWLQELLTLQNSEKEDDRG